MKYRIIVISALLGVLAASFACSNTTPAIKNTHWLEQLKVMPANETTLRAVYVNDFAKFNEKYAQNPQYKADYTAYFHPLIGGRGYDENEWQQTLTFTLKDLQQSIYAGSFSGPGQPPYRFYEAAHCRFDKAKLDNAVKTGPLNNNLQIVDYNGQQFYSWGADDQISLLQHSVLPPLGQGNRLALLDNNLCWVRWTDGIKEMIDCHNRSINSLADNNNYKLLANALDDMDTTNAFFSSESQSLSSIKTWQTQTAQGFTDGQEQRFLADIEKSVLLKPYQAYASGAGFDEKGSYLVVAFLNSNSSTAHNNAALLKTRIGQYQSVGNGSKWSELITTMSVKSEGNLTVAKLYGSIAEYWSTFDKWNGFYEPLLATE